MDSLNKEQALETAFSAAEAGAGELMSGYGRRPQVRHKGTSDLVTEYDLRSEAIIRQIVGRAFPDHLIVGEEEGASGSAGAAYKWYVDPLDGTTNFVHGHPFFAVSICLAALGPDGREEPLVGVIQAPALGDLYWGLKGHGAFRRLRLPGRRPRESRLAVTETADLRSACLNTGFPYDIYSRGGEVLPPFSELIMAARTIRRAGSAALDMAYVATGLADGFWETGLKPWDVAGGMVLLTEAGGQVSDYQGRPYQLGRSRDILGSNGWLHPVILEYLK
ncbi:MAG: inositol monophosphatase [Candidatus Adiutrix sp.]|jgi:myo-inositol-1(or 4)-monophosphatase|nr:inositol monophosphatase [Candidatus Adiutrix sp.]